MGRPALENLLMKELGLTYGGARKLVLEGRTSLGMSKFAEWTDELAEECRRLHNGKEGNAAAPADNPPTTTDSNSPPEVKSEPSPTPPASPKKKWGSASSVKSVIKSPVATPIKKEDNTTTPTSTTAVNAPTPPPPPPLDTETSEAPAADEQPDETVIPEKDTSLNHENEEEPKDQSDTSQQQEDSGVENEKAEVKEDNVSDETLQESASDDTETEKTQAGTLNEESEPPNGPESPKVDTEIEKEVSVAEESTNTVDGSDVAGNHDEEKEDVSDKVNSGATTDDAVEKKGDGEMPVVEAKDDRGNETESPEQNTETAVEKENMTVSPTPTGDVDVPKEGGTEKVVEEAVGEEEAVEEEIIEEEVTEIEYEDVTEEEVIEEEYEDVSDYDEEIVEEVVEQPKVAKKPDLDTIKETEEHAEQTPVQGANGEENPKTPVSNESVLDVSEDQNDLSGDAAPAPPVDEVKTDEKTAAVPGDGFKEGDSNNESTNIHPASESKTEETVLTASEEIPSTNTDTGLQETSPSACLDVASNSGNSEPQALLETAETKVESNDTNNAVSLTEGGEEICSRVNDENKEKTPSGSQGEQKDSSDIATTNEVDEKPPSSTQNGDAEQSAASLGMKDELSTSHGQAPVIQNESTTVDKADMTPSSGAVDVVNDLQRQNDTPVAVNEAVDESPSTNAPADNKSQELDTKAASESTTQGEHHQQKQQQLQIDTKPAPETITTIIEKLVNVNGKLVRRKIRQTRLKNSANKEGNAPISSPQPQQPPSSHTTGFGTKEKIPGTTTAIVEEVVKVDGKLKRRKVRKVRRKRNTEVEQVPQSSQCTAWNRIVPLSINILAMILLCDMKYQYSLH